MRIGYKVSWLAIDTALLATAILGVIGYQSAKRQYLAGIDRQLSASAAAMPRILGETYLVDAIGDTGIAPDRYRQTVRTLDEIADQSGVNYLYAFAQRGEDVVHLATSANQNERTNQSWATYLKPYEAPAPELLATFRDGQPRYAEYTDEFGSFRSIFVRHLDSQRRPFVVGVDISLDEIHHDLQQLILRTLAAGVGVAVIAGAVGILLARRVSKPLIELTREVDAWSSRDFAKDDTIRAHLVEIADRQRDEAGDLARRFVDVQDRLQTYLHDLTEATAARQTMEHQLEIAKSIQEGLLPDKPPKVANFDIVGWCKPADQTGGDYFDWIELPDGKMMLTIGDVTGHGIGPALVTAASRAYARATFNSADALEATVARLNDLLHNDLKGDRFVTLIACLLDPPLRQMKLVAAGHGPILFYSKARDTVDITLDTHGVPLGAFSNCEYDAPTQLTFAPGDVLVLVSDGFYDWMDPSGEPFGNERLCESVLSSCRADPTKLIERLRSDIAAFNQGRHQHDDTTALVIRCVS